MRYSEAKLKVKWNQKWWNINFSYMVFCIILPWAKISNLPASAKLLQFLAYLAGYVMLWMHSIMKKRQNNLYICFGNPPINCLPHLCLVISTYPSTKWDKFPWATLTSSHTIPSENVKYVLIWWSELFTA